MLYIFRSFFTRSSLLLLLLTAAACHSDNDKIVSIYNNHQFDQKIIEKLPDYDSLAVAILRKFPLFQKFFNENDASKVFRYMPVSADPDVFTKLPQDAGTEIDHYYNKLGKDFIRGFDLFKDSTIKIYARVHSSDSAAVDIEDNLSYYPPGTKMKEREFPDKDSILNNHWQYWMRFNKQGFF